MPDPLWRKAPASRTLLALGLALVAPHSLSVVAKGTRPNAAQVARPHVAPGSSLARSKACGSPLDYQVRLDRIGFSPGPIDGRLGRNTRAAIRAFQEASGLAVSGSPDCATWERLAARDDVRTLLEYRVSDEDLSGPFVDRIPADLIAQAELPSLSYTSPLEAVAERFHVTPALLRRLNPGAAIDAGQSLRVPNVLPDLNAVAVAPDATAASGQYTVQVSRRDSSLVLLDAGGRVVFFAPATVGSRHDPLPVGDWTVTVVDWNPVFHYNPELFWDANPKDWRATIQPGPNNPVGVVSIGLNQPHYGIHGTPEPSLVGHAFSHGCVRLTNWDVARVARLVRKGTTVQFR